MGSFQGKRLTWSLLGGGFVFLGLSCGETRMAGVTQRVGGMATQRQADVAATPPAGTPPTVASPPAQMPSEPTAAPTEEPTVAPTVVPTSEPTLAPTTAPASCDIAGFGTVAHGQSVSRVRFAAPLVINAHCVSERQTATCDDGKFAWSGNPAFLFDACQEVWPTQPPAEPTPAPTNPLLERRARYWKQCTFNGSLPLCEPAQVWCASGASTSSGCRMAQGGDVPNTLRGSPCSNAGSVCRNAQNSAFECRSGLVFDDATNNKCQAPGLYQWNGNGAKYSYDGNGHFCWFATTPAGQSVTVTSLEPNSQGYVNDGRCSWDR